MSMLRVSVSYKHSHLYIFCFTTSFIPAVFTARGGYETTRPDQRIVVDCEFLTPDDILRNPPIAGGGSVRPV
jgi:hypothetical protein